MALPDGFLDDLRARLTLSDIAGRKVTWDRRKSNPAKGDFWAPCPFHQEKTPSFHVDDRKGFYYCFGCHAKGDLIGFVKETENLGFMEAVERLAAESGLEMPRETRDPRAAERRDRMAVLAELMEEAVRLYARAYRSAAGQGARAYAEERGLSPETLARFEIGYAPDSRTHQTEHFRAAGRLEEAVAAGLVIRPEDGGAPYDRFRDRLMFPIRDGRGRCIAFGGRALSPNARAKYLNSPETDLFHKGRVLYNEGPAREAAGKTGRLILAEGYMDVIALSAAGFADAVAPLGTAITGDQLARAWRIAPEPVVALDGDAAGLRAAHALVDVALPQLAPGRSLSFCLLPEGQDPDDLLRAGGPRAMTEALAASVPLVEMLWRRETGQGPLDTPERKAELNRRLKEAIRRIPDRSVRQYYVDAIAERWAVLFPKGRVAGQADRGALRGAGRPLRGRAGPPPALSSELARSISRESLNATREAAILLICIRNTGVIEGIDAQLEELTFTVPEFGEIRDGLLSIMVEGDLVAGLARRMGRDPLTLLERLPRARGHPCARARADLDMVRAQLAEMIERHRTRIAFQEEMADAARDILDAEGEDWTHRVRAASEMPMSADAAALREEGAEEETRSEALSRMLTDAEAGAYGRKKSRPPTSNQ